MLLRRISHLGSVTFPPSVAFRFSEATPTFEQAFLFSSSCHRTATTSPSLCLPAVLSVFRLLLCTEACFPPLSLVMMVGVMEDLYVAFTASFWLCALSGRCLTSVAGGLLARPVLCRRESVCRRSGFLCILHLTFIVSRVYSWYFLNRLSPCSEPPLSAAAESLLQGPRHSCASLPLV